MVDKAYLLKRPPPPSAGKRWLDQRLIPALINAIGPAEGAFYRVSEGARDRPLAALLGAAFLGFGLGRLTLGRRRRA